MTSPPPQRLVEVLGDSVLLRSAAVHYVASLTAGGIRDLERHGYYPPTTAAAIARDLATASQHIAGLRTCSQAGCGHADVRTSPDLSESSSSEVEGWWTTRQAGALLGLSERQVRRRRTEFSGRKVHGTWLLDPTLVRVAAKRLVVHHDQTGDES